MEGVNPFLFFLWVSLFFSSYALSQEVLVEEAEEEFFQESLEDNSFGEETDEGMELDPPLPEERESEPMSPEMDGVLEVPELTPPNALQPFAPTQNLRGLMRIEPTLSSPAIRQIKESDQIEILRSSGEWYEVDVLSQEGINFRGWVQGDLAIERQPVAAPEFLPEDQRAKPKEFFIDEGFRWFFSGRIEQPLDLRLGLGAQNLRTNWTGRVTTPGEDDPNPPSSQLTGIDVQLGLKLRVLQWNSPHGEWTSGVRADYHLGHYQVNFASDSSIPVGLRGSAYKVRTHRFSGDIYQSLRRRLNANWHWEPEVGLGAFYLESSPDLKAGDDDQVIFTQLSMTAPLLRFGAGFQRKENLRLQVDTGLLIFPNWSETPSNLSPRAIKRSGIPLWLRLQGDYFWMPWIGTFVGSEVVMVKAQQEGPSLRSGTFYDQVKLSLGQIRLNFGLVFKI
jgi:hypothetical protein